MSLIMKNSNVNVFVYSVNPASVLQQGLPDLDQNNQTRVKKSDLR